ncbi:MAG: DMT family transporter [Parcubacteria group bacterium]|nr:DMT family transporter [Parcubacteria group bacterium]
MKEFIDFFFKNWILIVILGNLFAAISSIISKIALSGSVSKPINPTVYAFYSGLGGSAVIFTALIFNIWFNFLKIGFEEAIIGVISGIFLIFGLWPFYLALYRSEASRVMTLFVGSMPIFTFMLKYFFLGERLNTIQFLAFIFLVSGGVLVFLKRRDNFRLDLRSAFLTTGSALGIAIGLVLAGETFRLQGFFSGFFWISIGYLAASLIIFLWPGQKQKILAINTYAEKRSAFLFFSDKTFSILGSGLVKFAISLVSATLVNAFEGLRQFFVLILAVAISFWRPDILKEELKGIVLWQKVIAAILVGIGLFLIVFGQFPTADHNRPIIWGVTFSSKFSKELGLNPKENLIAILDNLEVDNIRLIAYWDEIEKEKNTFDFSDLDWQINEAQKRNVKIILVIGMKVPRWPECYMPNWAEMISNKERENELKLYLAEIIKRYKNNKVIKMWQVENEPFLRFGECPEREKNFIESEISLVKSLDKSRPILITDGGEFGWWPKAAKEGDIFGTTMYRRVYNKYFGRINYHLPPEFFILKEKITRFFINDHNKKFIVIELSAEPWMAKQIYETGLQEQLKSFDIDFFKDTIQYAKATGFDEYYLWGAEWWYYMKVNGHPEFWEEAKKLWQ